MPSIDHLLVAKAPGAINPENPTPLYYQVYSLLKDLILDGTITHGQRIPAEEALADVFNVSRITAKRAMDELAQEGLIERRRGRGSHVVYRSKPKPMGAPMVGVLEEIERVASVSEASTLECLLATPPTSIRQEFELDETGEALHLVRVRSRKGQKFGYYASWTAWHQTPADVTVFKTIPRLEYFKERGFKINHVTQTLSATAAPARVAMALNLSEGAPVLLLVRRSYQLEQQSKKLMDHLTVYYNPDHFQYEMTMDINP